MARKTVSRSPVFSMTDPNMVYNSVRITRIWGTILWHYCSPYCPFWQYYYHKWWQYCLVIWWAYSTILSQNLYFFTIFCNNYIIKYGNNIVEINSILNNIVQHIVKSNIFDCIITMFRPHCEKLRRNQWTYV